MRQAMRLSGVLIIHILSSLSSALGSALRSRHANTSFPFGLGRKKEDKSTPVTKMPARGSDPLDPFCLANTGFQCGDGKNNCEPWVACAEGNNSQHFCTCPHWGCADSAGTCRPVKSKFISTEMRLMSLGAAIKGTPHRFATMKPAGKDGPTLQDGWPAGEHPEALWKFLLMADNATIMIATKQGNFQKDGHFLSLPPAPWGEDVMIAPIQVKPQDALQASWRLFDRPRSRTALQHIPSGRFLCYDGKTDAMSTCQGKYCAVDSADFEVWPRLVGVPTFRSAEAQLPPSSHPRETGSSNSSGANSSDSAPWYLKKGKGKKEEPVSKHNATVPWYLRKQK